MDSWSSAGQVQQPIKSEAPKLPGDRKTQHKEEKAKINTFFDSCKFDQDKKIMKGDLKSPFKTIMETS